MKLNWTGAIFKRRSPSKTLTAVLLFSVFYWGAKAEAAMSCKNIFSEAQLFLLVSAERTTFHDELALEMLPRGSALLTSSGALKESGITAIIHAASGSMTKSGSYFEPTIESIRNSVANSVRLAERNGHQRLAIPMIGGGIFLSRLGIDLNSLAKEIVSAAMEARQTIELRFIGFEAADVQAFTKATQSYADQVPLLSIGVIQGSITDGRVHGASAIVNAANMEVEFGGGLSGAIGRATQQSTAINQEAKDIINQMK